jgi:HEAT repeat protein
MGAFRRRPSRRTKAERLRDRDVKRLLRRLDYHDWLVDRDGVAHDVGVNRRMDAIAALGKIDDERAEDGVIRALEDDHPSVRRAAVEALRPAPGERVAQTLARAAATWQDASLEGARAAAVDLLVDLGDSRLAVEFARTLADDEERDGLTAQDREALRLLFPLESDRVALGFVDELANRLATPHERELRRVQETLAAIGSIAVPPLIAALKVPARQYGAAAALAMIRDTRAVPPLLVVVAGGDAAARAMAARALGEIRDPRGVDGLIRASRDADPEVRDCAMESLDRLRGVLPAFDPTGIVPDSVTGPGELEGGPMAPHGVRPPNGDGQRTLLQRLLGR